MRRIRVEHKTRRLEHDRVHILPLDPRDPDILRAKHVASEEAKRRERA